MYVRTLIPFIAALTVVFSAQANYFWFYSSNVDQYDGDRDTGYTVPNGYKKILNCI